MQGFGFRCWWSEWYISLHDHLGQVVSECCSIPKKRRDVTWKVVELQSPANTIDVHKSGREIYGYYEIHLLNVHITCMKELTMERNLKEFISSSFWLLWNGQCALKEKGKKGKNPQRSLAPWGDQANHPREEIERFPLVGEDWVDIWNYRFTGYSKLLIFASDCFTTWGLETYNACKELRELPYLSGIGPDNWLYAKLLHRHITPDSARML